MNSEMKQIFSVVHPAEHTIAEHTHKYHELVYCLEGKGNVFIDSKRHKFHTGTYYITHRATPHSEKSNECSRIIYFYFDAPKETVTEGAYTDYNGRIRSTVKKLYEESMKNLVHKEKMCSALLTEILIEAGRAAAYPGNEESIYSVLQYIDENIDREIDLKQLAARHGYSYDRFRHIFKEHTGVSPHQYIINARIEKVKFLMTINPNASLTELAYGCGFTSSSQFSNIFRAKEGMTPTEYIKLKSAEMFD